MKKILSVFLTVTLAFSLCSMLFSCSMPISDIGDDAVTSEDGESPRSITPQRPPHGGYSNNAEDTEKTSPAVREKWEPDFDVVSLSDLAEFINHNADPPLVEVTDDGLLPVPGERTPPEEFVRADDSLDGKELTVSFDEMKNTRYSFELVFYPEDNDAAERTLLFYDQMNDQCAPIAVIFETDYGNAKEALSPVQLSGKIVDAFLIPWNEYMFLSSAVYQMTNMCSGEISNTSSIYYSTVYQGKVNVACREATTDINEFEGHEAIYKRTLDRYYIDIYP